MRGVRNIVTAALRARVGSDAVGETCRALGVALVLSACAAGDDAPGVDLPVELAPGATLIFDRGYISQHGVPGFNTDMFRGIHVRDVARRGDDVVVLLNESWLAATTYSRTEPGGVLLPNPGGGSNATYFLRSSDGGQQWASFLPADIGTLGGIGPSGWHLMEDSWLFFYFEPGGAFSLLRRYATDGETPVADAALDGAALGVPLTATEGWLGGWGKPMVIGGSVYQSVRLEGETVFVDTANVSGVDTPRYAAAWGPAASRDGATWFAVAPTTLGNGACLLETRLDAGPVPAEPVACAGDLSWSKALQGELWEYGQRDSRAVGALLSWGPTGLFSHKGKVWAYPLEDRPARRQPGPPLGDRRALVRPARRVAAPALRSPGRGRRPGGGAALLRRRRDGRGRRAALPGEPMPVGPPVRWPWPSSCGRRG